jgi:hypothetical protein
MGQVDCHPGMVGLQARNNQVSGNLDGSILVAGLRLGGRGLTNGHPWLAPVMAMGLPPLLGMGTKKGPRAFGV